VNQTRPHCVNQMGKTHSKPLAARHGRGTAWARRAMCESAFIVLCLASSCCRSSDVVLRYHQHCWLSTFWGTSAL